MKVNVFKDNDRMFRYGRKKIFNRYNTAMSK